MLDSETKQRINTARDILVGKVPDPKSQVEQITIALIYKFMDDMDKEAVELGGRASFFTGEYEKYSWTNIFSPKISGFDMINLYGEAIEKLNTNPNIPQLFRDIFKNAYLPYRDPETLKLFLKTINEFHYDHSEKLGDAFEFLLSVLGTQGDAGQFRTPRHIIDFIVACVQPKKDETICDPACGTAGFIIAAYKYILQQNTVKSRGDKLTPDDRKKMSKNFAGYDIDPNMVRLALANMYLHGFASPNIHEYDSLTSEDRWNESFDVILANPPFMSPKGGIKPHKRFSVQAKKSEVLFVDYIAEHLNTTGRAGIIVPNGIVATTQTAYKQLRQMLVNKYLVAVVSLPAGVFNPYSGVKTSILLLDKELNKKSDSILFVKIDNDGYDLGAQRREFDKNDLPQALETILQFKDSLISKSVFEIENTNTLLVPKEKILKNKDVNLSGSERYKKELQHTHEDYGTASLEEIFTSIKNGKNVTQIDSEGKYRVSRIQTIANGTVDLEKTKWTNDEVEEKDFLNYGDILLSHINSIEHLAKTAIFNLKNEKVVHGINLLRFVANREIVNPFYAILVFKCEQFLSQAKSFAKKAVNQASISTSDLKLVEIPLPPLSIQQQIVNEIEGYQKIIDGASMVVNNYKPNITINPDWEMVGLGEVGKICMCKRVFKEETAVKGDVPFYKIGTFGREPDAFISQELFTEYQTKFSYPKKGDILISTSGTIGKTVVFDGSPAYFQDSNIVWIANDETKISNKFLNIFYQMVKWRPTEGVTIARLYNTIIEETKIPLPSLEEQNEIVSRIEHEQQLVNASKQLITLYQQKIKNKIAEVWGEKKEPVIYDENNSLSLAAEE